MIPKQYPLGQMGKGHEGMRCRPSRLPEIRGIDLIVLHATLTCPL